MRWVLAVMLFFHIASEAHGQYFQFSQYNFTSQRINPAVVASSDYAEVSLINRNQSTGGGFHLNSNFFNASYPLINRRGMRWSGIGVSLMDDRAGQTGLFTTQEVAISYALSIPVAVGTSVSLGFKGLHSRRKVDLDNLHTGLQFVPDRGFDETRNSGENFGRLSQSFNTFSAGIFWIKENKKRMPLATAGIAFFDFNKPDEAFLESAVAYSSTLVGSFSYLIAQSKKASFYPEFLVTLSAGRIAVNGGLITSYELKSYRKGPSDRLDIITKFRSHDGPLIGLQLHKENFSVGASYDFPVLKNNSSNHGALEIGIALKRLVDRPGNLKRRRNAQSRKPSIPRPQSLQERKTAERLDSARSSGSKGAQTMSDRLKSKQDSVLAMAIPGEITHEPLIMEKATLHFNFTFNSTELDENARAYLDEVAQALKDNPEMNLELTGHTDNVGSPKFNLRLSLERAKSIRDYLIAQGVEAARITAQGKGLSEPLNNNATDEERALNRRVEMKIVYSR
jgi:type IX secretion system PorP/SprF family membrane protein